MRQTSASCPERPWRPSRREALGGALAALGLPGNARAQAGFESWIRTFRPRALSRGIAPATYDRVMSGLAPDMTVLEQQRTQPEFTEELWQYIYRRVSDFRILTGRERARQHAGLLARLERDYRVDRFTLLSVWGMESSFGDVVDNPKYMRPVFPALAVLAWREPRRRAYWEQELINALRIVERGWAAPRDMIGSWAGAMGHTQWMPEAWLNIGVDYDGDGRVSPFAVPDALAGTARFLLQRSRYRIGEPWGYEVAVTAGFPAAAADNKTWRAVEAWRDMGLRPAGGGNFSHTGLRLRLWQPVSGGPAFLIGQNFLAARAYNPSSSYALAVAHLADRIRGGGPFVQLFPGAEERIPTVAEIREIQQRLTAAGFDTGGVDGRVGSDTMRAVRAFQQRAGMTPADGYAGLAVLARLRQGR